MHFHRHVLNDMSNNSLSYYDNRDCQAMLDVLFKSQPKHTSTHPDDYVRQLGMTRKCDAIMPFLAVARNRIEESVNSGMSPSDAITLHDQLYTRNLQRQYLNSFGVFDYLFARLSLV
jgi:hypothetical protein